MPRARASPPRHLSQHTEDLLVFKPTAARYYSATLIRLIVAISVLSFTGLQDPVFKIPLALWAKRTGKICIIVHFATTSLSYSQTATLVFSFQCNLLASKKGRTNRQGVKNTLCISVFEKAHDSRVSLNDGQWSRIRRSSYLKIQKKRHFWVK